MSGKCGGGKARRCSNEVGKAGQLLNGIGRLAYLLIPTHSVPERSLDIEKHKLGGTLYVQLGQRRGSVVFVPSGGLGTVQHLDLL